MNRTGDDQNPDIIAERLGMRAHPEGGRFVETFRDAPDRHGRARSTAIYYLLTAGESSAWHRIDAAEIWHHYAGATLALSISTDGVHMQVIRLGPDIAAGERPQAVVPPGAWQAAAPLGGWTLVGCTVAPGFEFSRFELAPSDWRPGAPHAC